MTPVGPRQIRDGVSGSRTWPGAYELHCGAVTESRTRNRLSEAMQRELDRRFGLSLRHSAKARTPEALAEWWHANSSGKELPGALWATLTHPRCTPALEHDVLGAVHMLQHQLGMATRVELERFEALIDENAVLARELAGAQARSTQQAMAFARRRDACEAALIATRARLMVRDTELAQQREALAALEATIPDLPARRALAEEVRAAHARVQTLQAELQQARQEAERQRRRAEAAEQDAALRREPASTAASRVPARGTLDERAVLCVGGRVASVPVYRQVIERTGGRFLHHDGGEQESTLRLEATLAAADLVICQTGCISHDAYWRVKDHCKRTGKRCVFVDAPSRAALERALAALDAPAPQAGVAP